MNFFISIHRIRTLSWVEPVNLTEFIQHVMDNPEFKQNLLDRIPLGRIAVPKDVVGAVLFFCSSALDFITGQILYVDGGITASQ